MKKNEINILDPLLASMFAAVNKTAQRFKVHYFLIGAVTRDIQLAARPGRTAKRKTNDIDIAVIIETEDQFDKIIATLIEPETSGKRKITRSNWCSRNALSRTCCHLAK